MQIRTAGGCELRLDAQHKSTHRSEDGEMHLISEPLLGTRIRPGAGGSADVAAAVEDRMRKVREGAEAQKHLLAGLTEKLTSQREEAAKVAQDLVEQRKRMLQSL
jgi:hypothetical protein